MKYTLIYERSKLSQSGFTISLLNPST